MKLHYVDGPCNGMTREVADDYEPKQAVYFVTFEGQLSPHWSSEERQTPRDLNVRRHVYMRSGRTQRGTVLYEYWREEP